MSQTTTDTTAMGSAEIAQDATETDAATGDTAAPETSPTGGAGGESADTATGGTRANREAARYRTQLREVEAERDALTKRLTAMERAAVEHLAGGLLVDSADVWRDGLTLDELRGEDGSLDPEKVTGAVQALAERKPHWAVPRRQRRAASLDGLASGIGTRVPSSTSWTSVLQGREE